ncbi:HD domain-containing protein [Halobacillus rhizosphaerae]|uniref:HD domain-containing protein n=1 Tax=Halobacillus rhizosphaerae TaxID=3064889 RepID=UPI00398B51AD
MREKAENFAAQAHKGQKRKNSNTDYIVHPVRVARILEDADCPEEVICEGFLHDVVEDTSIELLDIEREFSSEVMKIVAAHTEDKSKSWKERKQHTIHTLRNAAKEIKYLIVADKLDNLLSLEEDYTAMGEDIWKNFNAGKSEQKWYNESIAEVMATGLDKEDIPSFFGDYKRAVHRVFA